MVGELEVAFEIPLGNAPVDQVILLLTAALLVAADRSRVLLHLDRKIASNLRVGITRADIAFSLAMSLGFNLLSGVNDLLGPGVLFAFVAGRYYHPRREERILLFIDMRASTAIALMLSQFAGAADEALIVNPHETDAVAAALKRALEMPLNERRERHGPMFAHLLKNDIGQPLSRESQIIPGADVLIPTEDDMAERDNASVPTARRGRRCPAA